MTFPLFASNNLQCPELSPAAIKDGKVEIPPACILSEPVEQMAEISEGKLDTVDSPLQI